MIFATMKGRAEMGKVSVALAMIGAGAAVVCMIVAIGAGDKLHGDGFSLLSKQQQHQHTSVLSVTKTLQGFSVPRGTSLKTAQVLSQFEALCGGGHGSGMTKAEMTRIRQRADNNWWNVIKAFKTADEIQSAVLADPNHVHLIIYVAPGWCHFSQMQIQELQKNFDNLGASQDRVHFVDVDDAQNDKLVEFQGIKSFPTIVAVQGNYVLGRSEGYKSFDIVNKMSYADDEGKIFDTTFPVAH